MFLTDACSYIQSKASSSGKKTFPVAGVINKSGSTLLIIDLMSESNPLYTDNIMMRAAVPIAMPAALIAEMMLITLCDFFAIRYLPAMNDANLISCTSLRGPTDRGNLLLQKFLDMLHIVKRAVEIEDDLRNDAQLLAHLAAELASKSLAVLFESSHHSFSLI